MPPSCETITCVSAWRRVALELLPEYRHGMAQAESPMERQPVGEKRLGSRWGVGLVTLLRPGLARSGKSLCDGCQGIFPAIDGDKFCRCEAEGAGGRMVIFANCF